jgi:hypothetical protein
MPTITAQHRDGSPSAETLTAGLPADTDRARRIPARAERAIFFIKRLGLCFMNRRRLCERTAVRY